MKKTIVHITLLILMLLTTGIKVEGQNYKWLTNKNFLMEVRGHYGAFYHHHFEMEHFNAHFPAFECSFYKGTFGEREWEADYNYPYIGFTFFYSGLGGFDEIGKVYALYPFINYPLLFNDLNTLTLKVGAGMGYLTQKFDHTDNHYNFSIGSHLNAAVNLSFEHRLKVTPTLSFVTSFGLTHFSNGATKSPNYGLNTFSGAWGMAYYFRNPRLNFDPTKRPDYYKFEFDGKKWFSVDVDYNMGVKDVSQIFGSNERYLVHELSTHLLARFSNYSRAGISLSLVKDNSDKALPDAPAIDTVKEYQWIKPNIGVCYSMTMERMSFIFEIGAHLDLRYRSYRHNYINDHLLKNLGMVTDFSKGKWYEKVIIRYELTDNVFANIALTAHAARADFLCFGLGYRFNQKYYITKHAKSSTLIPGVR